MSVLAGNASRHEIDPGKATGPAWQLRVVTPGERGPVEEHLPTRLRPASAARPYREQPFSLRAVPLVLRA